MYKLEGRELLSMTLYQFCAYVAVAVPPIEITNSPLAVGHVVS